jgi:hypothetical protein
MTFTIDFSATPNGPVPGNLGYEFIQLVQTPTPVYNAEPAPSTYFNIIGNRMLYDYKVTGVAPTIIHGVRTNLINRLLDQDILATLFFDNPIPLLDPTADQFLAEFFLGYTTGKDEPADAVFGGGARAEWTSGGGWLDACKVFTGRLGTVTPIISTQVIPDTDGDDEGRLSYWKDKNAITIERIGALLTAKLNGVLVATLAIADPKPQWRLVIHVAAYNRTGSVYTAFPLVTGVSGVDMGPLPVKRPVLLENHFHEYASPAIAYYKVAVHDLVRQGKAKQVAPKMWELLEDVEIQSDYEKAIFAGKVGARYYTTEVETDFGQELQIVRWVVLTP